MGVAPECKDGIYLKIRLDALRELHQLLDQHTVVAAPGRPAPRRPAPRWPQGILLHGGLLHGGLKASCSMADCSKVAAPWRTQGGLLHGGLLQCTAPWQIWAAIEGDRSMADLSCHQRWVLHGRFGLLSTVAPEYLSWVAQKHLRSGTSKASKRHMYLWHENKNTIVLNYPCVQRTNASRIKHGHWTNVLRMKQCSSWTT
jgi:hypothetical protein